MFYWVAKNSKFPMDKWRFDKTDPHCSVALSTSNVFLLICCKLKTNFIANSQILYMGCLLTRECKQKKNPIFTFKSVRIRLRESVRLRECVNTVISPVTDTLVSGQLYLQTPFQIPVLPPSQTLYLHFSRTRTLSCKRTRTPLKMKIGFLFCLRSLVSGHTMYNN